MMLVVGTLVNRPFKHNEYSLLVSIFIFCLAYLVDIFIKKSDEKKSSKECLLLLVKSGKCQPSRSDPRRRETV